jgi:uncharacterized protein (DUF1800 family)
MSSCGGGGGGGDGGTPAPGPTPASAATPKNDIPSRVEASRMLGQATFGPTVADIDHLTATGYRAWLAEQFGKPQKSHRTYIDAVTAASGGPATQNHFFASFWQQAATGEDQLRQRVTFALSQIFVISFQDGTLAGQPRGVAAYYDTLAAHAFGNYRDLLEAVSRHPMMGIYLSALRNRKEAGARVPDENYAREVMQLLSIGLYELNQDGSPKLRDNRPLETYTNADISGLAKVFTGWSWAGPDTSNQRFFGDNAAPNRDWLPMQGYPQYHSTSDKIFLGVTLGGQAAATPEASLKIALDRLFQHPNVGPFIGRQLIQRLVTSNPSPAYVTRVAAAFADNGSGVRGDLRAVIAAILLDPEARAAPDPGNLGQGKLREPVVRLAHWMRSFNAGSVSGRFLMSTLDDPLTALGQTPLRAPNVFNFYRPGYIPPNTALANAGLAAPEMQITGEPSVVGYLNFMHAVIPGGAGTSGDIKADYAAEIALADTPERLLDRVDLLLTAGQMSADLRAQILDTIKSVTIPTGNPASALTARKNRVNLAVFLTMASPEYLVQK